MAKSGFDDGIEKGQGLMRPPIFVWEPNDLMAFDSVEAAERFVEPFDADEGEVYDSDGRRLRFEVLGGDVFLVADEERASHQGDLRQALLQAFTAVGEPARADQSLNSLVAAASKRFDATAYAYGSSLREVLARAARALLRWRGS
jgi:hypothetical protein